MQSLKTSQFLTLLDEADDPVILWGPPGGGHQKMVDALVSERDSYVLNLEFKPNSDVEIKKNGVIHVLCDVHPTLISKICDEFKAHKLVITTCVRHSDGHGFEGLNDIDDLTLLRAGELPGVQESIEPIRMMLSESDLKDWYSLRGLKFLKHHLTAALTCRDSWQPIWEAMDEKTRMNWRRLALFDGPFDMESAVQVQNTPSPREVAELLRWNILRKRADTTVEMWPGARTWAWEHVDSEDIEKFSAVAIKQAVDLSDVLEFSFLESKERELVQKWESSILLVWDFVEAGLVHLEPNQKLEFANAVSLVDHESRRMRSCIDRLEAALPEDVSSSGLDPRVVSAALRTLSNAFHCTGLTDNAEDCARKAEALSLSVNDYRGAARAMYEEVCSHRSTGNAQASLEAIQKGLEYSKKTGSLAELARLKELEAILTHTFMSHTEAEPVHREALSLARSAELNSLEAFIVVHLANIYWRDQDLLRARAALLTAEKRQREVGDFRALGTTLTGIATVSLDLGDTAEAERYARSASELHRASGQSMPDGLALLLQCRISIEKREPLQAERWFMEAMTSVPIGFSTHWESKVNQTELMLGILREDTERVMQVIRRARNAADISAVEADLLFVEILAALVDRNFAHAGMLCGLMPDVLGAHSQFGDHIAALLPIIDVLVAGEDAEEAVVDRASGAFLGLVEPGKVRQAAHVTLNSRLRFWVRTLEGLLPWRHRQRFWAEALTGPNTWVVHELLVRPPEDPEWLDLSRRSVPARVFRYLCELYWKDPDALASDDDLIEHAWPGEKMLADSATTRLQKAVSDLRKLGLGDVIERAENGYRIHPSQRVIKLPDEFDEWWLRRFRKTQDQAL